MKMPKVFVIGIVSLCTLPWMPTVSTGMDGGQTGKDQGKTVQWERIIGAQQTGDLVGTGTGTTPSTAPPVVGGAPWETTDGQAQVNLKTGKLRFKVEGLVLAVGSAPAFKLSGLDIGTPAGVTQVKGTLVCDVDGSSTGSSVLVDTTPVSLSAQGDAQFNGTVALPAVCSSEPDIAFLIRIVQPAGFADVWIAVGAVRIP